ncbi:alpha/beta hydrolase [Oceanithermus sp.]
MVEILGRRVKIGPPPRARWLISDFTSWKYRPLLLEGPVEYRLPRGAYFEYAFLDAAGRPFADPDNPQRADNPWYDYARAVALPGAAAPPEYPGELLGAVERLTVGGRRLLVYEPPERPRGCLLVFDGVAYYRLGRLARAAEALWLAGRVRPLRIVFSEPADRESEYRFDAGLERLVLDELPAALAALGGGPDCDSLWGASLGGLAALWLALGHPDVFGAVAAQSPALLAVPGGGDAHADAEWLTERYAAAEATPERLAVQAGLLEWLLAPIRRFATVLADRGAAHEYREYPSGHNWHTWRLGIEDALLDLFGLDLEEG